MTTQSRSSWLLTAIALLLSLLIAEFLADRYLSGKIAKVWDRTDLHETGSSVIMGVEMLGGSNAIGLRGPEVAAETARYRVLALGDSFTYGYKLFNRNSWPKLAEASLNQQENNRYQVLNGGRPGTDTRWQVDYLRNFVSRINPEMVVVGFLINDCTTQCSHCGAVRARTELETHIKESSDKHIPALYRLFQIGVLKRRISEATTRRFAESYGPGSETLKRCQDAFREFSELSYEHGFKLLVVIYPMLYRLQDNYPFQAIHDQMLEFWKAEGIDAHDLTPAFYGQTDTDLWVHPTDSHPNRRANQIAAARITSLIREHFKSN